MGLRDLLLSIRSSVLGGNDPLNPGGAYDAGKLQDNQHEQAIAHADQQQYNAKLALKLADARKLLDPSNEATAGKASARTAEAFIEKLVTASGNDANGVLSGAAKLWEQAVAGAERQRASDNGELGGAGRHEAFVMGAEFQMNELQADRSALEALRYVQAQPNTTIRSVDDLVDAWERLSKEPGPTGHELIQDPEAMKKATQKDTILAGLERLIGLEVKDDPAVYLPEDLAAKLDVQAPVKGAETAQKTTKVKDPVIEKWLDENFRNDSAEFSGPVVARKKPDVPVDEKTASKLANQVTAEVLGIPESELVNATGESSALSPELMQRIKSLAANSLDGANNDVEVAKQQLMAHVLKSDEARPALMKELRQAATLTTQLGRLPEPIRAELSKAAEGGPLSPQLKEMLTQRLSSGQVPPELRSALLQSFQANELRPELKNALVRAAGKNTLSNTLMNAVKMRLDAPEQIGEQARSGIQQALTSGKMPEAFKPTFESLLAKGSLDAAGRAAIQKGLSSNLIPAEFKGLAQQALDTGVPSELRGSLQETLDSGGQMPESLRVGLLLSPHLARLPTNLREQLNTAMQSGVVGEELKGQLQQAANWKLPEEVKAQIADAVKSGQLPPELSAALKTAQSAEELPWALRNALAEHSRPNGLSGAKAFGLLSFMDKHGEGVVKEAVNSLLKPNADGTLPNLSKDGLLNELMVRMQRDADAFGGAGTKNPMVGQLGRGADMARMRFQNGLVTG